VEEEDVKQDLLELPIRRRIYLHIQNNPGVHFREMLRDLDLPIGQLEFHLNEMVKRELIIKEAMAGNTRFYVRDRFRKEEKAFMNFLRKEVPRDIILFLLENPGATPNKILQTFSFTGPNLSYHLKRMEKARILECRSVGRERYYFVTDPATVKELLVMYRATLFDKVLDKIA
jgi:predicted transcriptional regulator